MGAGGCEGGVLGGTAALRRFERVAAMMIQTIAPTTTIGMSQGTRTPRTMTSPAKNVPSACQPLTTPSQNDPGSGSATTGRETRSSVRVDIVIWSS